MAKHATVEFDVVSNPEFLREGYAVDDFLKPDRVVIGVGSKRAEEVMTRLYQPFIRQGNPLIVMDERSAELTKYAANCFLADQDHVHERDREFLREGGRRCGQGPPRHGHGYAHWTALSLPGHWVRRKLLFQRTSRPCTAVADTVGFEFEILTSVMEVNERQKTVLFDPLLKKFNGDLSGVNIALWGLAFKPETDDIREAPALYMIEKLLDAGASVTAFDPEAMDNVRQRVGDRIASCQRPIRRVGRCGRLAHLHRMAGLQDARL